MSEKKSDDKEAEALEIKCEPDLEIKCEPDLEIECEPDLVFVQPEFSTEVGSQALAEDEQDCQIELRQDPIKKEIESELEKLQRKQSLEDYSVKHEASIDMPVYMCNQCDYESIFLDTLKRHIGFKHGSDKHVCSYCGAALMSKHSLQGHIEAKHMGIRYACDQCSYSATAASSLKRHKKVQHQGFRYPCHLCNYQATVQSHLRRHKISKHFNELYT